ncbi:hypothetical protein BrE312_2794 [Brenneria sp. EniD312]|nr:hypothetical protein BrE312_2794 [Brenneria sp. EniD312]
MPVLDDIKGFVSTTTQISSIDISLMLETGL